MVKGNAGKTLTQSGTRQNRIRDRQKASRPDPTRTHRAITGAIRLP